jgi:hypothetical protein
MPLARPAPRHPPSADEATNYGLSAYTSSSKSELVQFLHASAFSPVPATLIEAIGNNQFGTWPGFTNKTIHRHLPKSFATAQGHLDCQRQSVRTTKAPSAPSPTRSDKTCNRRRTHIG